MNWNKCLSSVPATADAIRRIILWRSFQDIIYNLCKQQTAVSVFIKKHEDNNLIYLSIHLFVTTQKFTENMNYVHYCDVRYLLLSTTIYISTQHIMIITSITRPVLKKTMFLFCFHFLLIHILFNAFNVKVRRIQMMKNDFLRL